MHTRVANWVFRPIYFYYFNLFISVNKWIEMQTKTNTNNETEHKPQRATK